MKIKDILAFDYWLKQYGYTNYCSKDGINYRLINAIWRQKFITLLQKNYYAKTGQNLFSDDFVATPYGISHKTLLANQFKLLRQNFYNKDLKIQWKDLAKIVPDKADLAALEPIFEDTLKVALQYTPSGLNGVISANSFEGFTKIDTQTLANYKGKELN